MRQIHARKAKLINAATIISPSLINSIENPINYFNYKCYSEIHVMNKMLQINYENKLYLFVDGLTSCQTPAKFKRFPKYR